MTCSGEGGHSIIGGRPRYRLRPQAQIPTPLSVCAIPGWEISDCNDGDILPRSLRAIERDRPKGKPFQWFSKCGGRASRRRGSEPDPDHRCPMKGLVPKIGPGLQRTQPNPLAVTGFIRPDSACWTPPRPEIKTPLPDPGQRLAPPGSQAAGLEVRPELHPSGAVIGLRRRGPSPKGARRTRIRGEPS